MRLIKGFVNILTWIVYACIACYLLIATPMLAGYHPVVVLSGSMEPTYTWEASSIIKKQISLILM